VEKDIREGQAEWGWRTKSDGRLGSGPASLTWEAVNATAWFRGQDNAALHPRRSLI
jgi:hypothetical protein